MMFDNQHQKDKIKGSKDSSQQKEDKFLVKKRSMNPKKGHTVYKVIEGELYDLKPEDFIENRIYLHWIAKDGSYSYRVSVKLKEAEYVSSLNKKNAKKKLT